MSEKQVRVRFAPSPTGHLHVGNARAAILNYLFAKHHNGTMILRIEDTDAQRSTEESIQTIVEDLNWLGLKWEEGPLKGGKFGPYKQSERYEIYRNYADKLLEKGLAYRCFCSEEEIEKEREKAEQQGIPYKYSGKCGKISKEKIDENIAKGLSFVVRFKVGSQIISFKDLIMEEVSFQSETIGDFVIIRSDGSPIYNFCCVIDDNLMEISHVIRGDGHLANTPKQILIYKAFGWEIPNFAHTPMILDENRKKLSKRKGATSVDEFKNEGYLPHALINFLSLLSWSSPSGDEILSIERLIKEFDFSRMNKSGAVFDPVKLNWMNGVYIKELDSVKYFELLKPYLTKFEGVSEEILKKVTILFKPSLQRFSEISDEIEFFFADLTKIEFSEEMQEILKLETTKNVLETFTKLASNETIWSFDSIKELIKNVGKQTNVKGKNLFMPLRIAITKKLHGPELPAICEIFGKDKTILLAKEVLTNL
ncbi:glutamate--tRNA ligase [bacterium]|nr:glutamate--tRNA ligase [bacterium]